LALFELADEQRKLDQVANDLKSIESLLTESDDLRRLIGNPVVSRGESGRAMAALVDRVGADDLTKKFIGCDYQGIPCGTGGPAWRSHGRSRFRDTVDGQPEPGARSRIARFGGRQNRALGCRRSEFDRWSGRQSWQPDDRFFP
jgi:hypothetical protein